MSIKIGDFDVAAQLLDNEYRIGVMEKLLERVLNNNPKLILPTLDDLESFRQQTVLDLKKKYPNSGIEYKKK